MPPLAAGAHEVEQAIEQPPHVRRPWTTSGLGRRDQRLQQAELGIRQRLAGPAVPNQRAIRRRPHDGVQARNPLGTPSESLGQLISSPPTSGRVSHPAPTALGAAGTSQLKCGTV